MWYTKCWFWLHGFAQASPRFLSWPHNSLSCPPGHKAWLFCNLILVGIPAVLPCSWAAECAMIRLCLLSISHIGCLHWSSEKLEVSPLEFYSPSQKQNRSYYSAHGILASHVPTVQRVRKSLHTDYPLTIDKKFLSIKFSFHRAISRNHVSNFNVIFRAVIGVLTFSL